MIESHGDRFRLLRFAILLLVAVAIAACTSPFEDGTDPSDGSESDSPALQQLPAPALSAPAGKYFTSVDISLSVSEPTAAVHYTLDGSEPTEASTGYGGSSVSMTLGTTQLRARAFAPGFAPSPITEASYEVVDGIVVTTANTTGPGSLDEALTKALPGDEIRFDGDYTIDVVTNAPDGWVISSEVTINGMDADNVDRQVTIVGTGGVTDQRVFTLTSGGSLSLENLTIRDSLRTGTYTRGGAVKLETGTTLTTRHVSFEDNDALQSGGAIYLDGGTAVLEDTTFTRNGSDWQGGAIYAENAATLTVARSTFDANFTERDNLFSVPFRGGAISLVGTGSTGMISDSSFVSNRAHKSGAALSVTGGASTDIVRSDFVRNHAGAVNQNGLHGGGAINIGEDSTVRVAGSHFLRNRAERGSGEGRAGGAIRNGGVLLAYGNVFNGNRAEFTGAAIYSNDLATETTINSSSFAGNQTLDMPDTGAAIYVAEGSVDINYSSFADNDNLGSNASGAISISNSYSGNLRFSSFKNGGFDPTDFAIVAKSVAEGVQNQNTEDADPKYLQDPSPGADGEYGFVSSSKFGEDDDYGDLRPAAGSPLLAPDPAIRTSFLLEDVLDVDGDGDTTEPEPFDASGTQPRIIDTLEIGAWEVAN